MDAQRLPDAPDGLIRLRLPKGMLLVLTPQEWRAGLKRGKAERRAARFAGKGTTDPAAWITQSGLRGPHGEAPDAPARC